MATNAVTLAAPMDTKTQIICAASKMFAQQGFDGTSIRDIVKEAGVSKPVLYYYFKNKEDLYISIIHEAYEFMFKTIREIIESGSDFMDRLRLLTHFYLEGTTQFEDIVRLIYSAAFGASRNHPKVDILQLELTHTRLLEVFFAEGMNAGLIRSLPLEHVVLQYTGLISNYISFFLLSGDPLPEQTEEMIITLLIDGIGAKAS